MSEFYMILTNTGLAKLTSAQITNGTVNLTHLAVGDGNGAYYTPSQTATGLKREVWRGPVASVEADVTNPNWLNIEGIIPATAGGFTIRELGIFDGDGNLFALGKVPETYKPVLAQGSTKDLYLKAILEVSNTSNVTMVVDPNVIVASRKYVEDKVSTIILATQNAMQQLTNKVSTIENTLTEISDPETGVDVKLTQHLADYSQFKTQVEDTISEISDPETGVEAKIEEHLDDYVKHPGFTNTTNSGNNYSCTLTPSPATYIEGMGVVIKINVASTGASKLNVNGLGDRRILKSDGVTAVTNLKPYGIYSLRYSTDLAAFILQGESEVEIGQQILTPKTTNQAILKGIHDGTGYVAGSTNLTAANIKNGVNIFGVVGNLQVGAKITQVPFSVSMSKLIQGNYGTWQETAYPTGIVVPSGVKQILFTGQIYVSRSSSSGSRVSAEVSIGETLVWFTAGDPTGIGLVETSILLQKNSNTVENISYKSNYGSTLGRANIPDVTGTMSGLFGGKTINPKISMFSNNYETGTASISGTITFIE